ncbi:hypothetical protein P3S68_014073 [Capsicum galapagoense]
MKKLDEYVNRSSKRVGLAEKNSEISGVNGEEWDWECWKKHFTEVEEEDRLISVSEKIQDSSHAIRFGSCTNWHRIFTRTKQNESTDYMIWLSAYGAVYWSVVWCLANGT